VLLNRSLRANIALMGAFRDEFAAVCARRQPDVVIAESVVPVAGIVAQRLGIPWWTLMASAPSVMENRTAPTSYVGGWSPLDAPLGPVRDWLGWTAVSGFKRAVFALYRRNLHDLGFPSLYRDDGTEIVYSPERILMAGVRELEFARAWPPHVIFAGPLLYAPPPPFPLEPPPAKGARKRVFVTMGTQIPWFKERAVAAVRAAAYALPQIDFRCSLGDRTGAGERREGNLVVLPYADYAAEIALCDLVIHHAGTGIANEVLSLGVPSLVHPVDYDQFDTAARLCAAGVARRLRSLSDLPRAVPDALADRGLRARSAAFAQIVARYDAVALVDAALATLPRS
jgi:UDP:flavonoid glycosyltransferase YjiC (YdhE family)